MEYLTIGDVAQRTGVPAKSIRYYEEQGVVPRPIRSDSGYRLYGPTDIRRLRLVREAKLLGLSLPEIRIFVAQAFASSCADFADQFLARISAQRAAVDHRIGELERLKAELDALAVHVEHTRDELPPEQTVAGCDFCPILDVDINKRPVDQGIGALSGDGHAPHQRIRP